MSKCLMCPSPPGKDGMLCDSCAEKHTPKKPESQHTKYYECQKCQTIWTETQLRKAGTWGQFGVGCGDSECGGVVPQRGVYYNRVGGEGSDRQIEALQQSYRERFVKKEMDDVKHQHGDAFTDSIRGAAVERIKKGEKPT